MEKIIFGHLYGYFEKKNEIFPEIYIGTDTALRQLYDKGIKASNQRKVNGAMMLDLSAAFDLVDHAILNKKLKIYG